MDKKVIKFWNHIPSEGPVMTLDIHIKTRPRVNTDDALYKEDIEMFHHQDGKLLSREIVDGIVDDLISDGVRYEYLCRQL